MTTSLCVLVLVAHHLQLPPARLRPELGPGMRPEALALAPVPPLRPERQQQGPGWAVPQVLGLAVPLQLPKLVEVP